MFLMYWFCALMFCCRVLLYLLYFIYLLLYLLYLLYLLIEQLSKAYFLLNVRLKNVKIGSGLKRIFDFLVFVEMM